MPKLAIQMTVDESNSLDHQLQSIWTGRAEKEEQGQERLFNIVHSTVNKLIQEAYEIGETVGKVDLD